MAHKPVFVSTTGGLLKGLSRFPCLQINTHLSRRIKQPNTYTLPRLLMVTPRCVWTSCVRSDKVYELIQHNKNNDLYPQLG